jgi:AraC-like DNA-binding protein
VDSTVSASAPGCRPRTVALGDLVFNVLALLDCARREIDRNRDVARASLAQASSLLLDEIQRAPAKARVGRLLPERHARRVREYIDNNFGRKLVVSELSELVSCSDAHFARAFKRTFGMPPHAYLTRRRLEQACHLMRVSDASLTDIALSCGFTDQSHLCRIFRAIVGQSPGAWRRQRGA